MRFTCQPLLVSSPIFANQYMILCTDMDPLQISGVLCPPLLFWCLSLHTSDTLTCPPTHCYIAVSMGLPHDLSISSERPRAAVWITSFDNFASLRESLGEGNGTPLQYCCLENPRKGGAWWAAIYSVAQSRTWLKRLSSSSSRGITILHCLILNSLTAMDFSRQRMECKFCSSYFVVEGWKLLYPLNSCLANQ